MREFIGYFDGTGITPAYDPDPATSPCLVCMKPLRSQPVCTLSMRPTGHNKSYFFRVHKSCWGALSEKEQNNYESSVVDKALREGK
jgi:hypothetical protein